MAFLIWGRKPKSIEAGPAGTESCPTCGESRSFRWRVSYQMNHLYYVFGFVSGKAYEKVCEACGTAVAVPGADAERLIGRDPIPFMDRNGLLAAFGGVLALVAFAVLLRMTGPEPRNVPELLARARNGDASAVARLKKEADSGDAPSRDALAQLERERSSAPPTTAPAANGADAFSALRAAAEKGDANAQHDLGTAYELGRGTVADPAKALEWYRKAEAQGVAASANSIGVFYLKGLVVPADAKEATRYFRKAAEKGNPAGCYNLAGRYATGTGVPRDLAEARRWLERDDATEDPSPDAQAIVAMARFALGQMYEHGAGVEKSTAKALEYYQKASPLSEQARAAAERLKTKS